MSHENNANPAGNPEPVSPEEGQDLLRRVGTIAAFVGGGIALAVLLTPTRVQGSTFSGKLKWLQRQAEIQRTIDSQAVRGVGTSKPPTTEMTASDE